jgi:endonuclease VIII
VPEGHSVHRIARQFGRNFVGEVVHASSPQGRFADGAARLDGLRMLDARAVGKQMFLEFEDHVWLRVHLGMYGAWDFAGDIVTEGSGRASTGDWNRDTIGDATFRSAGGRMGQTNQRGTVLDPIVETAREHEDSPWSIGAPRRSRLRMAEQERAVEDDAGDFPAEPVGQVRVRLLTDRVVADLRGPTACEVQDPSQVDAQIAKLGPDPLVDDLDEGERRFVETVRKKATPIGLLLMDQAVVSGIGNVYRAELLFRARIDPHRPGRTLSGEEARGLWRDWVHLLAIGVETGQMLTMDDLDEEGYRRALANRADRHWVYHRTGEPCRVCGTAIVMELAAGRKLYYCPTDQV